MLSRQADDSITENNVGNGYLLQRIQPKEYGYFAHRHDMSEVEVNIFHADDSAAFRTDELPFYYRNKLTDQRFRFEVIDMQEYIDESESTYQLVTTQFECVLYDEKGDSITITDGEMKSLYSWYD